MQFNEETSDILQIFVDSLVSSGVSPEGIMILGTILHKEEHQIQIIEYLLEKDLSATFKELLLKAVEINPMPKRDMTNTISNLQ